MEPISMLAIWVIKQIGNDAETRARLGVTSFLLGSALERALVQPTSDALAVAIRGQLGDMATAESERRAVDVMKMIWTSDLVVIGYGDTLLGQVREVVTRAIDAANAPVFGLPKEFQPTSCLTSLSDELGVVFDGDAIGESFVDAWVRAVRDRALTNPVLAELANHLAHEQTQEMIHRLPTEERIGQLLRSAIQSSIKGESGDAAWIGRQRWFQVHVTPVDEAMQIVYKDYSDGFVGAASAVRSGQDLDSAIAILNDFRRRHLSSRIRVQSMARVLAEERARSPFEPEIQESFSKLLLAVEGFIFGADAPMKDSWYSYYIDEFERLSARGEDPMERSNYAIAGDHDLRGPLAWVLRLVADKSLPAKWGEYVDAFAQLQVLCLSA